MDTTIVRPLIEQSWSVDTSIDPKASANDIRRGQCLTTALLVHRYLGGKVLTTVEGGAAGTHYLNLLLDEQHDFVGDHQLSEPLAIIDHPDLFLELAAVRNAFQKLEKRWLNTINCRLPVADIEHVVVISESQLVGGYLRPRIDFAVIHGSTESAVTARQLFPGQTVWFKLKDGPIVCRSMLHSWFTMSCRDVPLTALGEYCARHAPKHVTRWWNSIVGANDEFFTVLQLEPGADLDVPLYPAARARQRSLISLDSWSKKLRWLYAAQCELRIPAEDENYPWPLPGGIRYRFRWEHLLGDGVSRGIDERTRRNARFHDRVATVDRMLQLFLIGVDDAERRLEGMLSSDDIDLLADVFEGHASSSVAVAELVEKLPAFLTALSADPELDADSAAHLRWVARAVEAMTTSEQIGLFDFLQRNGAINWTMETEGSA